MKSYRQLFNDRTGIYDALTKTKKKKECALISLQSGQHV